MEGFIIAGIIVAVLAIFFIVWWISAGNNLKRKKIKIDEALSGIEVALTKRYDMLTKLLDVAKGFASHEKELYTEVIKLRRGMTVGELNETNAKIDKLASGINVVAEAYPALRSSEVFRELQSGIRDTEEHLQAARRLYNSNVTAYNTALEVFPSSIVANSMKLQRCDFFVAEAAKRADVKMNF